MKDINISYFKNVADTRPKTYSLDKWLKATISPPKDLKNKVLQYRKSKTKSLKLQIPCVTVSASFKKIRNLDNIKNKTNLICFDVDRVSNPVINMDLLKNLFSQHPSTRYVGYSVGGDGIYAVLRVSKEKELINYFKYFKKQLRAKGIALDESCKDYTRLRFFSVDKDAYYNPEAAVFSIPKKKKIKRPKHTGVISKSDLDKVNTVVSIIETNAIEITSEYADWVKIAGALYNSFGENARELFHRVSRFNHGYKQKTTDRKFEQCMNMNKINLSTFFYIADSYGIRY